MRIKITEVILMRRILRGEDSGENVRIKITEVINIRKITRWQLWNCEDRDNGSY